MQIVFLGTSDFAAGLLWRLAGGPHKPVLVVTRPDRPKGRGRRLESPPVAHVARELGIELIAPDRPHDPEPMEAIAAVRPDAVCVCAYGVLIKEPLLSAHELLNVHPSLLPRWRGAAPVERALMAGDERTGVSIMRLTAGLDSGPVCLQEPVPIGPEDDYGALAARLEALSATLLVRAIEERPPFVEQDEAGVTYAEKIAPADRWLDAGRGAAENARVVRALHPHIGARIALTDSEALGVHEATPAPEATIPPGELRAEDDRALWGCADGALELRTVQPAGRRAMPAPDWLRGRR